MKQNDVSKEKTNERQIEIREKEDIQANRNTGSMYSPGKLTWIRHLIVLSQFFVVFMGSILLVRALSYCSIM